MTSSSILLLDSCVVIDFVKAKGNLFFLLSRYIGEVFVPDKLVSEFIAECAVDNLSDIGLNIVHVDPNDELDALARSSSGKLSPEDWACLLTAKRLDCVCVTNDKALRNKCLEFDVKTEYGLNLLLQLRKAEGLTKNEALEILESIFLLNPRIKREVYERCRDILFES